jgi:hypothetical protein
VKEKSTLQAAIGLSRHIMTFIQNINPSLTPLEKFNEIIEFKNNYISGHSNVPPVFKNLTILIKQSIRDNFNIQLCILLNK